MSMFPRRGAGLLLLTTASACSLAPAPRMPATVVEMPEAYDVEAPPAEAEPEALAWWRAFDDPTLDRLIETALTRNLDLREAIARLEELRHRYRIARAPLFPALSLSGDANRSSTPANTGLGSQFGGDDEGGEGPIPGFSFDFPDRFEFTTYSASLGFSYELDFWGAPAERIGCRGAGFPRLAGRRGDGASHGHRFHDLDVSRGRLRARPARDRRGQRGPAEGTRGTHPGAIPGGSHEHLRTVRDPAAVPDRRIESPGAAHGVGRRGGPSRAHPGTLRGDDRRPAAGRARAGDRPDADPRRAADVAARGAARRDGRLRARRGGPPPRGGAPRGPAPVHLPERFGGVSNRPRRRTCSTSTSGSRT